MDYRFLLNQEEEFFIEITAKTFSTKIVLGFYPDDSFRGIAVGCNYSFNGHPVGYLKDNGLDLTKIVRNKTSVFEIEDTVIQAGPTLVDCHEKLIEYRREGFAGHEIVGGFHPHIGKKKNDNIILGFTDKLSVGKIAKRYISYQALSAIKLPGHHKGSFVFKSSVQEVKRGIFPIPVALVFVKKLEFSTTSNKLSDFFR